MSAQLLAALAAALNGSAGAGANAGFFAYQRTGNGGSQSVTGVGFQPDVYMAMPQSTSSSKYFFDSVRGANKYRDLNGSSAESTTTQFLTSFDAGGVTINNAAGANSSGTVFTDLFWKKGAAYGLDVVLATGTGSARTIAHSLGVAPSMIWCFRLDSSGNPIVYHSSLGASSYLQLNSTSQSISGSAYWGGTAPTSSVFSVGNASDTNAAGASYVYLVFGDVTGATKATSFTTDGSGNASVTLGFKPGLMLIKNFNASTDWMLATGANNTGNTWSNYNPLNVSSGDTAIPNFAALSATGVNFSNISPSSSYILFASAA